MGSPSTLLPWSCNRNTVQPPSGSPIRQMPKGKRKVMGRVRSREEGQPPSAISIIGPGMTVIGDVTTDGTVRVEGRVTGTIHAGKAVVVGSNGMVEGEVRTNDAVIAGSVSGLLLAASRLEIQASSRIQGEVRARRIQLDEGALFNGDLRMGDFELDVPSETGVSPARPIDSEGDGEDGRQTSESGGERGRVVSEPRAIGTGEIGSKALGERNGEESPSFL